MKMSRVMKDSGISYIGNIPENRVTSLFKWGIVHIKTWLNPRDNFKLDKESPNFYVTIKNFKNWELFLDDKCDNMDDEAREIIHERSDIKKWDILFASISKDWQAYLIKEEPTNRDINESVFTIRVNEDYFLNKYFYYYIINNSFFNNLLIWATWTTFLSIKQNDILNSYVTIPPLSEQQKIADFLDKKCSKIDEQKANYEKSIELLKEYKQSLITKAVTKWLNSNAELKNSWVDWIWNIPKHWIIKHLKYEFKICNWSDPLTSEWPTPVYWSWTKSFKTCEEFKVWPTVLLGRKWTVNIPQWIEWNYRNVDTAFNTIRISDYNFRLFYYIACCFDYNKYTTQTALPSMTQSDYNTMKIPYPPIEEQKQIADYLDKECWRIDKVISYREEMIEKIEEYKKSLIYEYVTGKKEAL